MTNTKSRFSMQSTQFCGLSLCAVFLVSGCSTLQKDSSPDSESWSISKMWKKEYQIPQKMAVIWSPDILTMPGKPPTRGFGGRVFFYNERSQPVPVEGDLIVHGYLGDPEEGAIHEQADKTFKFTAEQLTSHFSPSQLGASYSIWIPWDDARGYQQQVNLIPTFQTKNGGMVQGAVAKLILPGKSSTSDRSTDGLPVQTISFQESATPTNNGVKLPEYGSDRSWDEERRNKRKPRMRTTTIQVPNSASLTKRRSGRVSLELGGGNAAGSSAQMQEHSGGIESGYSVGALSQKDWDVPTVQSNSRESYERALTAAAEIASGVSVGGANYQSSTPPTAKPTGTSKSSFLLESTPARKVSTPAGAEATQQPSAKTLRR